jgi:hypothetical protein
MGLAVCDGEPEICATNLKLTMPSGTFERFLCYVILLAQIFKDDMWYGRAWDQKQDLLNPLG